MTDPAMHSFAVQRLAQARRQYMDAAAAMREPPPGELYRISLVYATAEQELLAASLDVITTASLDGTETSPLTAESGNAER